jgi:hypothetical protein
VRAHGLHLLVASEITGLQIEDDSSRGRRLLPLLRRRINELPAPLGGSQAAVRRGEDTNLIRGQDEETTERLEERLRELGYIE